MKLTHLIEAPKAKSAKAPAAYIPNAELVDEVDAYVRALLIMFPGAGNPLSKWKNISAFTREELNALMRDGAKFCHTRPSTNIHYAFAVPDPKFFSLHNKFIGALGQLDGMEFTSPFMSGYVEALQHLSSFSKKAEAYLFALDNVSFRFAQIRAGVANTSMAGYWTHITDEQRFELKMYMKFLQIPQL